MDCEDIIKMRLTENNHYGNLNEGIKRGDTVNYHFS